MARWTLCRQNCGIEEFSVLEGEEVTIGRGFLNKIELSGDEISRHHCIINVLKDHLIVTDLKSANGTYIGLEKMAPCTPYIIAETDLLGIGCTASAALTDINDSEKCVFKLVRQAPSPPIVERIQFQSDNELDDLETAVATGDGPNNIYENRRLQSPVQPELGYGIVTEDDDDDDDDDVIIISSDTDSDDESKESNRSN